MPRHCPRVRRRSPTHHRWTQPPFVTMLPAKMSKKRKAVARKASRRLAARKGPPRGDKRKRLRGGPLRPATAVAKAHTGSGLAPGMQAINTYLAVANVGASIEFLERTFGFSRGVVLPDADGQLRYAEMRH